MIVLGVEEQAGRPSKTSPDPGEAFVIFDGRERAAVLQTGDRLSPAELRNWGRRKVVRVLAAEQSTPIEAEVTASDGFRKFAVSLTVTWKVSDFIRAARGGSIDILTALRSAVEDKIGDLDRRFEMTQQGADELYQGLRASLELTVVEFIRVERVGGRVRLDASTAGHLAGVQRARDDAALQQARVMLNQQLEQARISKETEIQLVRKQQAVLEEETKVAVERLRHNFELEMATQRTLQELALMKQKLDLYGKLSGTAELVSLQLANDPSQVDVVLQNNRNHELVTARLHLDAVRALIDADAVEGFQLQDVAKRSLERFLQLASGDMAANQPQRVDAEISAAPALAAPTPAEVVPEAKPASEADGSSAGS